MSARRWLLAAGVLGICARSVAASGPATDLEGQAYAGAADGQWTCGPKGSVRYGGVGGQVRFQSRPEPAPLVPPEDGVHLELRAVAEQRTYALECAPGPDCRASNGVYGAGSALIGIDWRYIGVSGGLLGLNGVGHDGKRRDEILPQLRLRSPRVAGATRLELGFGSPTLAGTARPGLYVASYTGTDRLGISAFLGIHRVFEDTGAWRGGLEVRSPLGERAWFGVTAVGQGDHRFHPEGGLLFGARL